MAGWASSSDCSGVASDSEACETTAGNSPAAGSVQTAELRPTPVAAATGTATAPSYALDLGGDGDLYKNFIPFVSSRLDGLRSQRGAQQRPLRIALLVCGMAGEVHVLKALGFKVEVIFSIDPKDISFRASQLKSVHCHFESITELAQGKGHCLRCERVHDIPSTPCDIWVCGFPCQPWSKRRRHSGGPASMHSSYHFMDYVLQGAAERQPQLILLENPKAFMHKEKKSDTYAPIEKLVLDADAVEYSMTASVFNNKIFVNVGRERVWMLLVKNTPRSEDVRRHWKQLVEDAVAARVLVPAHDPLSWLDSGTNRLVNLLADVYGKQKDRNDKLSVALPSASKKPRKDAWRKDSAKMRFDMDVNPDARPWTSSPEVRLRGVPITERAYDLLDLAYMSRQSAITGQPFSVCRMPALADKVIKGLFCDTNEEHLSKPWGNLMTYSRSGTRYSFELDRIIMGYEELRLHGIGESFRAIIDGFSDSDLRTAAAEGFALPSLSLVLGAAVIALPCEDTTGMDGIFEVFGAPLPKFSASSSTGVARRAGTPTSG
eukprot:TRINITY_DN123406_c0_g1_i1.p1 TRINITY_DN123406_c0_g1~~TRINITY_DN123406_c0_g1_i1.p1  ORF type:complete len:547 (-),score=99.88 TRINITY_DN123406_c0_g1_i1:171-1811(-)